MADEEICYMPMVEMAKAIRTKQLSPVEVMDAVLNRIEELNPKVNAYCTLVVDRAKAQAKKAEAALNDMSRLGILHGIPVSIKDLIFTKDIRTTGCSKIYESFIPRQNAIVVDRLEAAGAIIIGKTNSSEFGWAAITDNLLFGATRNPWSPQLTPGGSSGGAAAAVSLGMGSLAIGSDGAGSIRIPSSFCGVFGFKPSFGRVARGPGFAGWETLSHTGPITRTVADAALAMDVIAGRDDRDRFSLPDTKISYLSNLDGNLEGFRIGWAPDFGGAIADTRVLAITETAVKTFSSLGATLEVVAPRPTHLEGAFSTYVGARMAKVLQDKLTDWRQQIDPALVRFIERNQDRTAAEYIEAELEMLRYCDLIYPLFQEYDLLLTPTVAVLPFELGSYGPREIGGIKVSSLGWVAFTYSFNVTGQPAASVPCGWTDEGLPVGLQIVGRRFDDALVMKAAAAFERVSPWANRYPPTVARW